MLTSTRRSLWAGLALMALAGATALALWFSTAALRAQDQLAVPEDLHRVFIDGEQFSQSAEQQLEPVRLAGISGPLCRGLRAYDVDDVAVQLEDLHRRLATAARRSSVELADYVDRRFPAAPQPTADASYTRCFVGMNVVTPPATSSAFQAAYELVQRLAALETLTIPLVIASLPTDARFSLRTLSGVGVAHSSQTDSRLPRVFRGLYLLDIHRAGHHAIEGYSVDLVDDNPSALRCVLYATDSSEESACRNEYN